MKRVLILSLALCLMIAASASAQRWAFGEDEVPLLFAVGIAGDAVPAIDGNLAEWDSYPAWNVMTFADNFIDNSFGTVKDLNSLDFTGKVAWHAGTNMMYYAFDVFDDVHVQESAKGECLYWNQDDLEIYIDADNSGGSYNGNEPEGTARCGPAQQLAIMLGGVGDDICTCSASKWSLEAPYFFWAGSVTEAATGTQTTYEVGQILFDFLDETPAASTIHNLFEGDVVGMSWDIDDQDTAGGGQNTAWYTTSLTALYREADNLNDVEMSPADWTVSGATAVESQSWGAIKATYVE
jgi:cellulose/xylan binding protein with CBM9 domain